MEKISLAKAAKYTSPNPVSIVCTQKPDGSANLATVSWWTYLSYDPDMIAYAMAKTSYSGEMVRANKKVVLTVPAESMKAAALGCGSTTGRTTDKPAKFAIEMQELPDCGIRVPKQIVLAIVCELKEYVETGDHYLYICNVKDVYASEGGKALFAWGGYGDLHAV